MIVIDWQVIGLLILAGLIATYIRLKDTPAVVLWKDGKLQMAGVEVAVETFFVSVLAAFLTAWILAEQTGVLITSWGGFAAIAAAALGGMATIRAAINVFKENA
jgi:Trk-type K+ transport system membrane component